MQQDCQDQRAKNSDLRSFEKLLGNKFWRKYQNVPLFQKTASRTVPLPLQPLLKLFDYISDDCRPYFFLPIRRPPPPYSSCPPDFVSFRGPFTVLDRKKWKIIYYSPLLNIETELLSTISWVYWGIFQSNLFGLIMIRIFCQKLPSADVLLKSNNSGSNLKWFSILSEELNLNENRHVPIPLNEYCLYYRFGNAPSKLQLNDDAKRLICKLDDNFNNDYYALLDGWGTVSSSSLSRRQ